MISDCSLFSSLMLILSQVQEHSGHKSEKPLSLWLWWFPSCQCGYIFGICRPLPEDDIVKTCPAHEEGHPLGLVLGWRKWEGSSAQHSSSCFLTHPLWASTIMSASHSAVTTSLLCHPWIPFSWVASVRYLFTTMRKVTTRILNQHLQHVCASWNTGATEHLLSVPMPAKHTEPIFTSVLLDKYNSTWM